LGPLSKSNGSRSAPAVDAIDDIRGLAHHASRGERDCVSGDKSVAFYVPLLEYPQDRGKLAGKGAGAGSPRASFGKATSPTLRPRRAGFIWPLPSMAIRAAASLTRRVICGREQRSSLPSVLNQKAAPLETCILFGQLSRCPLFWRPFLLSMTRESRTFRVL
jgi:hypothetical protein